MGPAEERISQLLKGNGYYDDSEVAAMLIELSHEWAEGIRKTELPPTRDRHWVRFGVNIAAEQLDRKREI